MTPQNKIKQALRDEKGEPLTRDNIKNITGLGYIQIDNSMCGLIKNGFAAWVSKGEYDKYSISPGQRILDVLDKGGEFTEAGMMLCLEVKIQDWKPYKKALQGLMRSGVKEKGGLYTSRDGRRGPRAGRAEYTNGYA